MLELVRLHGGRGCAEEAVLNIGVLKSTFSDRRRKVVYAAFSLNTEIPSRGDI